MLGSLLLLSMSCLWLFFCFQAPAQQSSSSGTLAHPIIDCSVLSNALLEILMQRMGRRRSEKTTGAGERFENNRYSRACHVNKVFPGHTKSLWSFCFGLLSSVTPGVKYSIPRLLGDTGLSI